MGNAYSKQTFHISFSTPADIFSPALWLGPLLIVRPAFFRYSLIDFIRVHVVFLAPPSYFSVTVIGIISNTCEAY